MGSLHQNIVIIETDTRGNRDPETWPKNPLPRLLIRTPCSVETGRTRETMSIFAFLFATMLPGSLGISELVNRPKVATSISVYLAHRYSLQLLVYTQVVHYLSDVSTPAIGNLLIIKIVLKRQPLRFASLVERSASSHPTVNAHLRERRSSEGQTGLLWGMTKLSPNVLA
jgi:hypothetical protein